MTEQSEHDGATDPAPLSVAEWVKREIAKAPDLSEDQVRNLCRIYGLDYDPGDPT